MALVDYALHKPVQQSALLGLSQKDLLRKRDEIDALLTEIRLEDVDLLKESLIQLKRAKLLQDEAGQDRETPYNQRAQVQNSLTNITQSLEKMQGRLHNSERWKRTEMVLVKVLREFPDLHKSFRERMSVVGAEDLGSYE